MDDVTLVHRGVVPAAVQGRQGRPRRARADPRSCARRDSRVCSRSPARSSRPRAAWPNASPTRVMSKLQQKPVACRTATTPLPGGSLRDIGLAIADARREFDEGLPTDTIPHLIAAYGSRYRDVMEIAGTRSRVADAARAGLAGHRRRARARGAQGDGADTGRRRDPPDAARCAWSSRRHRTRRGPRRSSEASLAGPTNAGAMKSPPSPGSIAIPSLADG